MLGFEDLEENDDLSAVAFVAALGPVAGEGFDVVDYSEHALGAGASAVAVAYVETRDDDGSLRWGVGTDPNTVSASFRAVLSAVDRRRRELR